MLLAATIRRGLARLAKPQILFPLIAAFLLAVIWGTTFGTIRVKDAAAAHAAAGSTGVLLSAYEALSSTPVDPAAAWAAAASFTR
ncbi:MAG TPA: hypothetical protein VK523_09470, partial [Steroidobacteraceae bacterium]|nr:hypothetical protein [Steroidobacteraceae bacterium]